MNESLLFGALEEVPLREAWAHEAHVFTPWLAENLDRLGEAIGLRLEFIGREVNVGRYIADILARVLDGGREMLTVLVGEGEEGERARTIMEEARAEYPLVEIDVHEGGQPFYPVLLAAE